MGHLDLGKKRLIEAGSRGMKGRKKEETSNEGII
jgi:hypothetical protein